MYSAVLLSRLSKNGVVSLKELKQIKYPLYKYVINNYASIEKYLYDEFGIEILNDIRTRREPEKIRLYLRYHFDKVVDITTLRNKHRTMYNYVVSLGNPKDVLEGMGFEVVYKATSTEDIVDSLKAISENGVIKGTIDGKLYNTIYYRASKLDMTFDEYLKSLGYRKGSVTEDVLALREKGKSFSQISKQLNVPKSTVYSIYKRSGISG